jgi:linoleoyl-CoA desaturase
MAQIRFQNPSDSFFNALRVKVDHYFKQNNLKQTGDFRLYLKTIILFTALAFFYAYLVFFTPENIWVSLGICALLGINLAAIGFNVMHDGAHGSYSRKKWVNDTMGYALNLLGGNVDIWKQKHNNNHHTYTNIEGMDDDIDLKPLMRVSPAQKKYWMHRFQHIYGLFLYCLTYLSWVFMADFKKYFSGKIAEFTNARKMSFKEHFFSIWASKIIYIFLFIILPIFMVGLVETIVGYLVMAFVTGLMIAIVFQLAHVVEDAHFVAVDNPKVELSTEWAVHQINTTSNFATKSKTLNWLLGGLNFQVEHHLFPRISHVHYPQINKLVKETCEEFKIAYREYPTMLSALKSHLVHLKNLGAA